LGTCIGNVVTRLVRIVGTVRIAEGLDCRTVLTKEIARTLRIKIGGSVWIIGQ
jgi:hypothetical protein